MKQNYFLNKSLLFILLFIIFSCGSDNDYIPVEPTSPVVVDLASVPYAKLSDYKFFDGTMKNQVPSLDVLPYEPASQLFTDYAHKKRFVWIPKNKKAVYDGDGKTLIFPVGTALIKTFYYDNIQPGNTTRIIETRIMIRKEEGWIFANYVWNADQTEATLDPNGSFTDITWLEEGTLKNTNYRIPSSSGGECLTCHKSNDKPIPIGLKPQNLNFAINYASGSKNQLEKWAEVGYLDNNFPRNIVSTVRWNDESQPLEKRVRSYIDINCAHCHQQDSHCSYRPMRFAFSETTDLTNLGVCMTPVDIVGSGLSHIVAPGSPERSVMHFRITSVNESTRMPLLGRSIVHEEAVEMIDEWITTLDMRCN
ncbi:hypothetical protein MH928_08030 [Flavobacterium sp. WW92]|uniref:hypothetical protein n=1 Tax=unclassified Flavobacterium TaxID=196869 RepID=UPI002224DD96|nr:MULTISPECIES: hypothetical protein [unclassified Flavobacterium]WDO14634.1 hypothetical protein MH928_08030 [Flavobacterium sp. WW92]